MGFCGDGFGGKGFGAAGGTVEEEAFFWGEVEAGHVEGVLVIY